MERVPWGANHVVGVLLIKGCVVASYFPKFAGYQPCAGVGRPLASTFVQSMSPMLHRVTIRPNHRVSHCIQRCYRAHSRRESTLGFYVRLMKDLWFFLAHTEDLGFGRSASWHPSGLLYRCESPELVRFPCKVAHE